MQSNKHYKPLIVSLLLLATTQAQATLTNYTINNADLVYSSVSDVSWTKDANLLGTMLAADSNLIDKIVIASAGKTYGSTSYTLDSSSFNANGTTTWQGGMAFINYLNSISYGGSSHWRLPTARHSFFDQTDAINAQNGSKKGEEYSELFHSELMGGPYGSTIPNTPTFDNEQNYAYWTGSEASENSAENAWFFGTNTGGQHYFDKGTFVSVWAISNGQIAAVPEPESNAMLMAGLSLLGFMTRRKSKI